MGFTTPRTYVAGEIHTAAHHNIYERDNIAWIATDSPAARAYSNVAIGVASGVESALPLNSERFDNAGVHSTVSNTGRFTVPTGGGGKYLLAGSISWAPNGSGSFRVSSTRINGSIRTAQQNVAPSASHGSDSSVCSVYAMNPGDYMELCATHDQGGGLNVNTVANYSPEASMFWFRT